MTDMTAIIAGMALVTFLPRIAPLLFLPGMKMSKAVERWLSLIAPAILSALLLPELLIGRDATGGPELSLANVYLAAAVPSFAVAWNTKSLFGTVATGIAATAFLRLVSMG
jgi:branched-subunit amino acid transport protein